MVGMADLSRKKRSSSRCISGAYGGHKFVDLFWRYLSINVLKARQCQHINDGSSRILITAR